MKPRATRPDAPLPLEGACTIRRAGPRDGDALAALLLEAFAAFERRYTPPAFQATVLDATRLRVRAEEGPVWMAEQDAASLGTVSALVSDRGLYVRSLAVHPDARGLGLGRRLLVAVETYAAQHGVPRLYLSTTPFLHDAIRLYERAGFVRTDAGPYDLHGTPLFTMEKTLP